ncbi:DDE endonuclease [Methylobacterium sp. Leaf90]|nr:DDE endonuclease [Methylobacterium sp. Leaf90]
MATALFDGPMTGARFRVYVEETLVPALKRGDTVVLDNLLAHKVGGIRERIEAAGAQLLYLPAYTPDFNRIELVFAKLKTILRADAARTVSELWDAIKRAFRRFSTAECRNYLAAAGYDAYDPT